MKRTSKGVTLIEITVMIAVAAIVSVMVVSFISLTQIRVIDNEAQTDVMDELNDVGINLSNWITSLDTSENDVSVVDDGATLVIGDMSASFDAESGVMTFGDSTRTYDKIVAVKFSLTKSGSHAAIQCTVTYKSSLNSTVAEQNFIFLKNSILPEETEATS